MSVSLTPPNALGFNRPLTQLVKRALTITNQNAQPVAFKVKTTAPKLYCVRPNSGRVEPGESVEVAVMLQAMKEEPPLSAKCKDKFLIQSTIITADKESLPLADIWGASDSGEEAKVHQQKLKVVYLPAEGQTLEEEDEGHLGMSTMTAGGESRFDTVRQHPHTNGHAEPEFSHDYEEPPTNMSTFVPPPHHEPEPRILVPPQHEQRPLTPPGDFNMAREDSHEDEQRHQNGNIGSVNVTVLPPRAPTPPTPPPFKPQPDPESQAKLRDAQAEIERLRALLAAVPSSPPSPPTEIRRRTRAVSDDGSTIAETEFGTMVDNEPIQQDGVPLQVVVIIALGVFITTYLFF